jgi:hypothetical protein
MGKFQLWAEPWWVNLLILVPGAVFFWGRSKKLSLAKRQLIVLTIFAASFGFVEAAVVVYLRAAVGLLPGYQGTLSDVQHSPQSYQQEKSIDDFPPSLMTIEVAREAATILMLVSVAFLAAGRVRERWASFLWAFAVWDIAYYAGLWATVRWPASLKDMDVLFLIPVPWVAQVWFPVLVSALTLGALGLSVE